MLEKQEQGNKGDIGKVFSKVYRVLTLSLVLLFGLHRLVEVGLIFGVSWQAAKILLYSIVLYCKSRVSLKIYLYNLLAMIPTAQVPYLMAIDYCDGEAGVKRVGWGTPTYSCLTFSNYDYMFIFTFAILGIPGFLIGALAQVYRL